MASEADSQYLHCHIGYGGIRVLVYFDDNGIHVYNVTAQQEVHFVPWQS